jgi:hypothetical protein
MDGLSLLTEVARTGNTRATYHVVIVLAAFVLTFALLWVAR